MKPSIAVIITTISDDKNNILKKIRSLCLKNNSKLILIGDKKSPKKFSLGDAKFISVELQTKLNYNLIKYLPFNSYSRKNIGYLEAIKNGFNIIIDTDDDNIPYDNFFKIRNHFTKVNVLKNKNWINVYKYFTNENIWPRGFNLSKILNQKKFYNYKKLNNVYIEQRLADMNPDVDAIYRLTSKLPIYFNKGNDVAILKKTYCPFNSQNTIWKKKAFPLLYLPSYCSFRMTDIYRSFVAQRICSEYNWPILFSNSSVYQKRNYHDLLKDFNDEVVGYLNIGKLVEILFNIKLKKGYDNIYNNIIKCYKQLAKYNFVKKKEIILVKSFMNDLINISKY
jgi:hypothetical protein